MNRILTAFALLAIMLAPGSAMAADVPNVMTSQGVVRNAAGDVVNGVYGLAFKLYSAQQGGQLLWSENQNNVVVENGVYTTTLGVISPLPASLFQQNTSVWLALSIEGEAELPRVRVTSVAFAFQARSALTAETAVAVDCTGCIGEEALDFDPVTEAELTNGNLTINGVVSATMFVGDGSGLTGISSPQGTCSDGWFVKGIGADGTLACEQAASAISSIDGLGGGTINGSLSITGDLSIVGTATVGGEDVCTSAGNCGDTLAQLACDSGQVAMYEGNLWSCGTVVQNVPPDPCEGVNDVLTWTGDAFECKTLTGTGPSGGKAQGFELLDSWGYTWDGMMRPAMNYTQAEALCESLDARLPTATEIWRVSQNQTKLFGPMATGDWLWTAVRYSATGHTMGRTNDGNMEYSGDTSNRNFRCVWTNNTKTYFAGNHCYGPVGQECFTLALQGDLYVIDQWDRPNVRYSSASAECAFYYAHVPDAGRMTQAIRVGLPNGSNNHLWTSDTVTWQSSNMRYHHMMRWSGVNLNFNDYWDEGHAYHDASEYRFRCVGVSAPHSTTPVQVANASHSKTYLTTSKSEESAATITDAIAACFNKGGHLASSNELYELVNSSLSSGSDQWMWTADWVGNWSSAWRILLVKWAGTISGIDAADGGYTTDGSRQDGSTRPYRCVWYPIDTDYSGPDTCNGGCYEVVLADTDPPVKMWMDKQDRNATNWAGAAQVCYLASAYLPNRRDMLEMIRASLPQGTNNWLWTSEAETVNSGSHPLMNMVRWAGVNDTLKDDQNITWGGTSEGRPFRCMWTNELR